MKLSRKEYTQIRLNLTNVLRNLSKAQLNLLKNKGNLGYKVDESTNQSILHTIYLLGLRTMKFRDRIVEVNRRDNPLTKRG